MNGLTAELRKTAASLGRADLTSLWAGQGAAMGTDTPAAQLLTRLSTDAAGRIHQLAGDVQETLGPPARVNEMLGGPVPAGHPFLPSADDAAGRTFPGDIAVPSLDGRTFAPVHDVHGGEVGTDTRFHYHQDGPVIWAHYAGGRIRRGHLVGTRHANTVDFR